MSTAQALLLETIKIEDGVIYNIDYHQKRCTYSREILYHTSDTLALKDAIEPPPKGLYRCRILYAQTIYSIEYIPYTPKNIHSLKIVSTSIVYDFKYAKRTSFDLLLSQHNDVDDILIEKEGYLRDTTIANIAFYAQGTWYTPKHPLLKGTMRQKLIDEGFLKTRAIKKEDLHLYSQVALMNAMIGFKILNSIHIIQGNIHDNQSSTNP